MTAPAATSRPGRALSSIARLLERRRHAVVMAAFAVTAGYLAIRAAQADDYVWLVDELLYVKVAESFAGGELLRAEIYDAPVGLPNALYPRMLGALYALLPSLDAFTAAHVLNGLLYASVIFPVYLLARRIGVPWGLALLTGLASAWTPWAVSVTVVMTEPLAYPMFVWALLAVVVAVADPSPRTHALALVAIALATYARVQFAFLLPVLAIGVLLHAVGMENVERRAGITAIARLRDRLRPHIPLGLMLAGVALTLAVLSIAGLELFGVYDSAVQRMRLPPGWLEASALHLAHVVVGIAILPAVLWLAWLSRAGTRPRNPAELALAITGGLSVAVLVYLAGDFAQNVAGGRVQERYMFYVAPVFLLGAAALLSDLREPRPRLSLVAAAIPVAALVGVPGYGHVATDGFQIVAAAASAVHQVLLARNADFTNWLPGDRLGTNETLVLLTLAMGVALVFLMRVPWRRLMAPAVLALLVAFGAAEAHYLLGRAIPSINTLSASRVEGDAQTPRDWVDQAAGDAAVGMLPWATSRDAWLRVEFWNESIDGYYRIAGHGLTGFPGQPLDVDEAGRVRTPREFPLLVVGADPVLGLRAQTVAQSAYGLSLVRPERPYRALWWSGDERGDGWSDGTGERRIEVFATGTLELVLTAPGEATRPVPYVVTAGDEELRGELAPGEARTVSMPVAPGVGEVRARAGRATRREDDSVGIRVTPIGIG